MNDLEKSLAALPKPEPDALWGAKAKQRLMHHVQQAQEEQRVERWFAQAGPIFPSPAFVWQAKARLMNQIQAKKARWPFWEAVGLGRFIASTLVMVLALFTTLFFTEGKTTVVAGDAPSLQVLWGEVKIQDKLDWRPVTDWMQVREGDLLRTGSEVDAILHFNENQLRLGPNTVLLVTQIHSEGEMRFNISQGKVWLQVPSEKKTKGFVSIETGSAHVLTPNASVLVEAEPLGGSTKVKVFNGVVRMTPLNQIQPEAEAHVLEPYWELVIGGKTLLFAPTSFSSESLANDSYIQTNLNRDRLHEKHLEEVNLERLKNALLKK